MKIKLYGSDLDALMSISSALASQTAELADKFMNADNAKDRAYYDFKFANNSVAYYTVSVQWAREFNKEYGAKDNSLAYYKKELKHWKEEAKRAELAWIETL